MSIIIESFYNSDAMHAGIRINKDSTQYELFITKEIENGLHHTIFRSQYASVKKAEIALKSWAKRNGYNQFIRS